MKFLSVFFSTFFVLFYECPKSLSNAGSTPVKLHKNVIRTIETLGYPAEAHAVETMDGYILTMHRIPHSKEQSRRPRTRPTPILLQHGLLGSSMDYFLISTGDALPLLLSDLGFDIWLGNIRGNTYSRRHTTLHPSNNNFWNYTWHEAAIYDVPAMVDYILNKTNADNLVYIGHSMGSTMYLALASTNPDIYRKIRLGLLMAPIGFASNTKSPLLRFLAPFSRAGGIYSTLVINGEFLTNHYILQLLTKYLCALPKLDMVFCKKYMYLIFGTDYNQFNPTIVTLLLEHYPAGLSTKAINHYAQLVKSGKFQQYDYGSRLNQVEYGSAYPPEYDLEEIKIPTYFYSGQNDFLATPEDVNQTAKYVRSLRKNFVVERPTFSHLDFLAGMDVRSLVYKPLIKHLMTELHEGL